MRGDAFQVLPRTVEGARSLSIGGRVVSSANCRGRRRWGQVDATGQWIGDGLYRALHPRTTPYFWSLPLPGVLRRVFDVLHSLLPERVVPVAASRQSQCSPACALSGNGCRVVTHRAAAFRQRPPSAEIDIESRIVCISVTLSSPAECSTKYLLPAVRN